MKRIINCVIFLTIFIAACQHVDKKTSQLLSKDKLLSQLFTINVKKDTILKTTNGALISIPEGALFNNSAATVQLEIKEAYSIEQIVLAGLTTQSNGQPLSSGGMIYINAVGGASVKIIKALSVKIPTPSINKNMQLFKGDINANGNINWVKPDSLPANTQTAFLDAGKLMFITNCASCHAIGKDGTGPDLAHILKRTQDKKLLYEYTRNNFKVMQEGNQYYRCLYESREKTAMNRFPFLTDLLLDTLYSYIENESQIQNLPIAKNQTSACIDSCKIYLQLKNKLESQKNKLSEQKVAMIIEEIINPAAITQNITNNRLPNLPSNKVVPISNQSLYYQFKIEAFGWYNIDILLKEGFNNAESSLMVRIIGQYKQNFNLYLVIPSAKILQEGSLLQNKDDEFGFYTKDGQIILPQNSRAYIFALGESEDQLIFDKKEFITSQEQKFDMTLSPVTKEVFNATIKKLNITDLNMTAYDTKIADTLRKVIKAINDVEKIKPKNCDCNCGTWQKDTTERPVIAYYSAPKK